ncbi:cholinesterase-like isoform X2 [Lineus longissimus]|uniref:cholinesterase-like isoform X2 n=1 Tax=Lineus longissimus TaxID=88925 RepID=UPI00315C4D8D
MTHPSVHILVGFILLCHGVLEVHHESTDVMVTISNGRIRGSRVVFDDKAAWQFLGIPFAKPPVGKLRFLAPEPASPWSPETYNATSFKPACMQETTLENDVNELESVEEIEYSEDCLYLNVFAPTNNDSTSDLLPVIVFIHGGEYSYGSAHGYLGYPLATTGVVVVTIQYRLGPFGFLSTIDPSVAGNAGMFDQIMALKWVQKNIKSFHGNPEMVTLFGHNSGATSACLHMLSPLSQGLFHQVIAIGGVANTPWAVKNWTMAAYYSSVLMRYVRCKDDVEGNILEELECMRKTNTSRLLEFSKKVLYIADTLPWFPIIGGPGDNRFLPRDLETLAKEPRHSRHINVMVGLSKNEGQYLFEREIRDHHNHGERVLEYLNATVHDSVIKLFLSRRIEFNMDAIFSITKHKYTYWPRLRDEEMFRQQLIQLYTDYFYLAPMTKFLQEHSLYAPSYMYLFDYHPDPNHPGAKQGAELKYVFGIPFLENDLKKLPKKDKNKNVIEYKPGAEEGKINSGTTKGDPILPEEEGIEFVPLDREGSGETSLPFSTTNKPTEHASTTTSAPRQTVGTTTVGKNFSDFNVTDSTLESEVMNKTDVRLRRQVGDPEYKAAEKRMSLFMMDLWKNFAKYGYPTLREDDNTSWLPFSPHQWNYAWIREPAVHIRHSYRHDKVALWNVYYPKLTIIPADLPQEPLRFEFNIYQAIMWCLLAVILALLALVYYVTRASLKRRKEPSRFADQSRYLTLSMQRMT